MSGIRRRARWSEIRIRQLERGGKQLSDEEKSELVASIKATYEAQTDCRYAAARLWVDGPSSTGPDPATLCCWRWEAVSLNSGRPQVQSGAYSRRNTAPGQIGLFFLLFWGVFLETMASSSAATARRIARGTETSTGGGWKNVVAAAARHCHYGRLRYALPAF